MDHVSDSDSENSLPQLSLAEVDAALVRNVYAIFSEDTKRLLRQQAKDSPFEALFNDISERSAEELCESTDLSDQTDFRAANVTQNANENGENPGNPSSQMANFVTNNTEMDENIAPLSITEAVSLNTTNSERTSGQDDLEMAEVPTYPEIEGSLETPEILDSILSSQLVDLSLGYPENTPPIEEPSKEGVQSNTETQVQVANVSDSIAPPSNLQIKGNARSKRLRTRKFSSRFPYIADKAEYLGIGTLDSINQLFEGVEKEPALRVLNQYYLRNKKRFPDDDLYRPKDFYTHLGYRGSQEAESGSHSRSSADEVLNSEVDRRVHSAESNYDPNLPSSQNQQNDDDEYEYEYEYQDDDLIRLDEFEIPYTQDESGTQHRLNLPQNDRSDETTAENIFSEAPVVSDAYTDAESEEASNTESGSEAESDSESADKQDEYIRVGGKRVNPRKCLRGIFPESHKRLDHSESDRPHQRKRRKVAPRKIIPRKGLAMKKVGSATTQSADLERELFLNAQSDSDAENRPPRELMQQKITQSTLSRSEIPHFEGDFPSLSRQSTSMSMSYMSDTPEVQSVSSGSDSDSEPEMLYDIPDNRERAIHITSHSPLSRTSSPSLSSSVYTSAQSSSHENLAVDSNYSRQGRFFNDDAGRPAEFRDAAEIDPLVARRNHVPSHNVPRKTSRSAPKKGKPSSSGLRYGIQKRTKNAPSRTPRAQFTGESRRYRQRATTPRIAIGRPAGTKSTFRANTATEQTKSRLPRASEKIRSRLPAFRKAQDLKNTGGPLNESSSRSRPKAVSKRRNQVQPDYIQPSVDQHFRRDPVVSTFAIEIESTEQVSARPPIINDSVIHRFQPSRQSLLNPSLSNAINSLVGFSDLSSVSAIGSGRSIFPGEDSVTISFKKNVFHLALYNPTKSQQNLTSLLGSLRDLAARPESLLRAEDQEEIHTTLRGLIKWFLICSDRPAAGIWGPLQFVLNGFSKLQTKEVGLRQVTIQSQFIFLYWILLLREQSHKSQRNTSLEMNLKRYSVDFFTVFLSSVSAESFISAYDPTSSNHAIFECLVLIFTIFEENPKSWWRIVTQAIEEMVFSYKDATSLLDLVYLLAAILPKKTYSWSPFLALLAKLKFANHSSGHRHFIETCEMVKQGLEHNYEEKVLLQLFGFFGTLKFCNFEDEKSIPASLGSIKTRANIPETTVFEKFLSILYSYISELSSAQEVKRLLSKLLPSSPYRHNPGRKSQIIFVNRLNLILLLCQISNVDLTSQLVSLIASIGNSSDPFLYGKSIDALGVFCESKSVRSDSLPLKAFIDLLESLAKFFERSTVAQSLYSKLIDLISSSFGGVSDSIRRGVFGMLDVFTTVDLSAIPELFSLEVIGTVFLSVMELDQMNFTLSPIQKTIVSGFEKSLLKFLGKKMESLPISNAEADRSVEEVIELGMQMWILLAKVKRSKIWNIMMYQVFHYLGNSIARRRFVMFFCIEFIHSGDFDSFVLPEIERILLLGLLSPTLSKYAVGLYGVLSKNHLSIFWSKDSPIAEVSSVFSLQNSRIRIITKALEKMTHSTTLHNNEKASVISGFVKGLHEIYTESCAVKGVPDMCKRIAEITLRTSKEFVAELDEFWELSTELGLPNKSLQNKWLMSDDEEKVKLLNVEFLTALAYGKSLALVMDNWKRHENDFTLYSLIDAYACALDNKAYWAHLALLLEYFLSKLEEFQITTNHQNFQRFLLLLKNLPLSSNLEADYSYALYEIRALRASCSILKHAILIFDGYKDQHDITRIASEFLKSNSCPRSYKIPVSFLALSLNQLRPASNIVYHPKFQHTGGEFETEKQKLKENMRILADHISVRAKGAFPRNGIEDFEYL